ncbi:hypothetical protein OQA88_7183 [Cercophora sp. LCS_1]
MSLQRPCIPLSAADLTRLRLAHESYSKYPDLEEPTTNIRNPDLGSNWTAGGEAHKRWTGEDLTDRVPNFPLRGRFAKVANPRGRSMILAMVISGFFYGGIHLFAWTPPSASWSEVLLWRVSSIVLALYATPLMLLRVVSMFPGSGRLVTILEIVEEVKRLRQKPMCQCNVELIRLVRDFFVDWAIALTAWVLLFILGVGFLPYLAARVYLPLEAIISIPRLPDSVFVTPEWSQFLPHLS